MTNQNKNCNTLFMQPEKGLGCVLLQFVLGENCGEIKGKSRRNVVLYWSYRPPKWCRGGDAMC